MSRIAKLTGAAILALTATTEGESPGTVGAMNNTGASSMPDKGEKKAPEGQPVKPGYDNC